MSSAAQSNNSTQSDTVTPSPTEYVKLVSCDGFEFIVDRNAAMISGTIKNMLTTPAKFMEAEQNEIHFRDIKAVILEKVCQFMYFKLRYTNCSTEIPEFDMEPVLALELLMASDFLDI